MRALLLALPLVFLPVPAAAAPAEADAISIPPELGDPAVADKLTRALVPLSRALMNMPIGELEAALAGREPTAADRTKRLSDEIGPEGQKELEASIAAAGPTVNVEDAPHRLFLPGFAGFAHRRTTRPLRSLSVIVKAPAGVAPAGSFQYSHVPGSRRQPSCRPASVLQHAPGCRVADCAEAPRQRPID